MIRGFEKELSAIKEKGQSDIQREENEFKADMEKMEDDHSKEMDRLRSQAAKVQSEKETFDRKRRETLEKHKKELDELEKKNKKEEDDLREQNMNLWNKNLDQQIALGNELNNKYTEISNQNSRLQIKIGQEEDIRVFKIKLLDVSKVWTDVKVNYQDYLRNTLDEHSNSNKSDVLKEIDTLIYNKEKLNEVLITAKKLLGKCQKFTTSDSFKVINDSLTELMRFKFEDDILIELKTIIKKNGSAEQSFLTKMDETIDKYNEMVNELPGLQLKSVEPIHQAAIQ